jgi:TetR/AcrR family transcriptional regulator
MGLTQGALFRHFPTKDAILEAVMARVSRAVAGTARRGGRGGAEFSGRAAGHVPGPHRLRGRAPPACRACCSANCSAPAPRPPKRVAAALLAQYAERLRRQLEQGRQQREFDPELDVAAAATLFIGSVQGLVMQALIAGDVQRIRDNAPARAGDLPARHLRPGPRHEAPPPSAAAAGPSRPVLVPLALLLAYVGTALRPLGAGGGDADTGRAARAATGAVRRRQRRGAPRAPHRADGARPPAAPDGRGRRRGARRPVARRDGPGRC